MASMLCVSSRATFAKTCRAPLSYIQKAYLRNDLPAVEIPDLEPLMPEEHQRFPENIQWPEELDWINTNCHRQPRRPYRAPADVEERLAAVFDDVLGPAEHRADTPVGGLAEKHRLLAACARRLGHDVTNSQLHQIRTLGDIVRYYGVSVSTTVPLEQLKRLDLPKNMHIQMDYTRFHPETDTKFGGISAFPKSSTVVTGLRYKKKYPGYVARKSWPYS